MSSKINLVFQKNHIGVGKRKKSIARVFLVPGSGNITINNVSGEKYLQYNETYLNIARAPLRFLKIEEQFDIIALVRGGGLTGQAESIKLGVSRLLSNINPKNRSFLKQKGYLTRDARIKERKKYGLRKARKAPQYSKR